MRLSGAASASPTHEARTLRGFALDGEIAWATADGSAIGALSGFAVDDDLARAQPLLVREALDDDLARAVPGILAPAWDDDMARATADLTDFAYERDFVLRALSELPAETLTDFVVLGYELAGSWVAAHVEHVSAFDVMLLDQGGTPLDHNIAAFDGTGGALRHDFRIPSLALGSDWRQRMRYGRLGVSSTYANTAGCFRRALAAWEWSAGLDLTGRNHDFNSISGVTQGTLKGPCGVFGTASAAVANAATWANGINAASLELWLRPSALPSPASTVFRLGTIDVQGVRFNLFVDDDGSIEAITEFGSRAWVRTAAGALAVDQDQHIVLVGQRGALPLIYKNGAALPTTTVTAPTTAGPIAATTADFAQFGVNSANGGASLPGRYGRAILWSHALTPGWVAASYAIQARPQACIGMGPELTAGTANRAPVAVPMLGTQAAGATADYDVAQRSYDAEGDTRTASIPSAVAGMTASIVAGKVRLRPDGGTDGQVIEQPVRVTDGQGRSSDSVVRVQVGAAVTGGYNPALPWGGLGIGAVCLFGQPGNQRVGTNSFQIVMMRAEHTGSIDRVAWFNKFNLAATGYHTGNGGQIKWRLRKITSAPGVRPVVLSDTWVETPVITDPVLPSSWNAALQAIGGPASVGSSRFHEFPTLKFASALAVQAGDLLAFQQFQLNSDSGTISINDAYTTKRVDADWSPFDYAEHSRVFKVGSLSETRPEHFPELLYGYTDGMICGNPHIGYANGSIPRDEEVLIIGGTAGILVRQVIPMPSWANGKRVRRVHVMMTRYDNTTTADIRCRIRKADSTAAGELLATAALDASGIRFETNIKGTAADQDPIPFLAFDFGADGPLLSSGTTYYVEMSTTGGAGTTRYMGDRLQRYIDITPYGLKVPSGFSNGFRGERNTGSGWAPMATNGSEHDIPVWVEFA